MLTMWHEIQLRGGWNADTGKKSCHPETMSHAMNVAQNSF